MEKKEGFILQIVFFSAEICQLFSNQKIEKEKKTILDHLQH
jgi:hypothetical protein